jgi:hypothetical protein
VRGGGAGIDYAQAVAVDGTGGVVAVGNFESGAATFGSTVLSSSASFSQAGFVWKLSGRVVHLSCFRHGGHGESLVPPHTRESVTLSQLVYLSAHPEPFLSRVTTIRSLHDVVITLSRKVDECKPLVNGEGTTLWAVSGGGMNEDSYDSMTGVAVDSSGDIVAAGYFSSPTVTFGTTVLSSAGLSDAVVWKLGATGSTAGAYNRPLFSST